jgi:hypothetical protein
MSYPDLADEVTLDPLGRGYSNMSPQEVAQDLQTAYRPRQTEVASDTLLAIAAQENAITTLENDAADDTSDTQDKSKAALRMIERSGTGINLASPTDEGLVDALMNGPLSGTSVKPKIAAAGEQDITRAQELRGEGKRLPSPIRAQHIIDIRS